MGERVDRFDVANVSGKVRRTPQGFAVFNANLTRTGVLTYRRSDGSTVRELRHPDEVFRADTLESLANAPLTDGHPSDGFVTPENVQYLQKGIVKSARRDGIFCAGEIVVQERSMIDMVSSDPPERKELSPGYSCEVEVSSGEYNGERYDAIQRNIVYNHIAALAPGKGRSGAQVSFRNDSAACEIETPTNKKEEKKMDPKDFVEVARFDALQAKFDQAAAEKEEIVKKNVELASEVEELKKRLDSVDVSALVSARVELETLARKAAGPEARFDGKKDREVKEAAILAKFPKAELVGKTDEYVSARFDAVIESITTVERTDAEAAESLAGTAVAVVAATKQARADSSTARAKMIEENKNAWRS